MSERYLGIDVGAETIKLAELQRNGSGYRWARRALKEHHKEPAQTLASMLRDWEWEGVTAAAVTGRLARLFDLTWVPTKQAQVSGFQYLHPDKSATVVSIGSHGFSVLELRGSGLEVYRENSRCSQGTGNFLRQLVERFNLDIEEASRLCETVEDPSPLSGRCPVILKTDMTHLANKGEQHPEILAGLYDAVCENIQVLIKPRLCPPRIMLLGGVSRSRRVRESFRRFVERHDMELLPHGDESFYLEALGSAMEATEGKRAVPALDRLLVVADRDNLDRVAPLSTGLDRVRRMPRVPAEDAEGVRELILGFDIGSTGSKAVALDTETREIRWEGYLNTNGNPVEAARELAHRFTEGPMASHPVVAFGATGSGREIVGSLLSTCFGPERVYVLNEIAAHAEGALHYDDRVDTIFEIGGQDAKYIRLSDGRVVDAAMNEACSAGTGSFIEEQGKRFSGVKDVVHLGEIAIESDGCLSLGQHCSVFMAEIIEQAVGAGEASEAIISGIYHSIIQNYMDRVKGNRSVGKVIFCQGMPFSSDALAAAVANRTGSEVVVPPNPGTVGALGISLLTLKSLNGSAKEGVDLTPFLGSKVERKDNFVCKSNQGCGGPGNRCRIDRLTTVVDDSRRRFTWGGSCSLWDKGTGKQKLPDLSPNPFREREDLVDELLAGLPERPGRPRIALTDEFMLKGLFPFFTRFLYDLGFDLVVRKGADQSVLKRGIEQANIPFCAPMQQYHGLVDELAELQADYLFLPMMRSAPRMEDEPHSSICPIVQGSPDIMRWDLDPEDGERILSPIVDVGAENLYSQEFLDSCKKLAVMLGVRGNGWKQAHAAAVAVQDEFDRSCLEVGIRALLFCRQHDVTPVVVLGRPYTIYNTVLNSNVPALLREQGAMAIPVDCYPVGPDVPTFEGMYWSYGQRNLRAAHQIRRMPGTYSVWCSNYSCGPDSFNLHFYAAIMEGKPFTVLETDGHSGDAGTKTRIEAFLHCVREDLGKTDEPAEAFEFTSVQRDEYGLAEIQANDECILIPPMGPNAEAVAACLESMGIRAEALPMPDRETIRMGRRYTSGKECLPMCVTLGSLLQRLEKSRDTDERFALFMPTTNGPCRFGAYATLHRMVTRRLGWGDRVSIWSPPDNDYFGRVPAGYSAMALAAFASMDILLAGFYDARPNEKTPGASQEIFDRARRELREAILVAGKGDLSLGAALLQVANGRLFGLADVLKRAGDAFARVRCEEKIPTVAVVGEIYVRCDPFSNDFVIDRLEEHGIRVKFAPVTEWLEYTDYWGRNEGLKRGFGAQLSTLTQKGILARTYSIMASRLGWPPRTTVKDTIKAAAPYIRKELGGEAVLTLGGPLHEWHEGVIDGVVNVGPLECMPTKIAETQFFHVGEREGLASMTLPLNGDPVDPEIVDNFVFEVKKRFRTRGEANADREAAG